METKTYISLFRLAALLLFLSGGFWLPAQCLSYCFLKYEKDNSYYVPGIHDIRLRV
jgi:hypothetical protein